MRVCDRCKGNVEVKEVYVTLGKEATTTAFRRELCKACYEATKGFIVAPPNTPVVEKVVKRGFGIVHRLLK